MAIFVFTGVTAAAGRRRHARGPGRDSSRRWAPPPATRCPLNRSRITNLAGLQLQTWRRGRSRRVGERLGVDKDGGTEYPKTLKRTPDDLHTGKFSVLINWATDRIARRGGRRRGGAAHLPLFRHFFRQQDCTAVSV